MYNPASTTRCEQCEWYKTIDSAFGYCTSIPPVHQQDPPNLWQRIKEHFGMPYGEEYSKFYGSIVVAWEHVTCSLFKIRK